MFFKKWKLLTLIIAGLTNDVQQLVVLESGSKECYDAVQTA